MDRVDPSLFLTYFVPPTSGWDYYYGLTNCGAKLKGRDQFDHPYSNIQRHAWQTRVRKDQNDDDEMTAPTGQTGNGGDAEAMVNDTTSSEGPKYPDGRYHVKVTAYSYPSLNAVPVSTTAERAVIIDNFRPYVASVTISNDGGTVYEHSWEYNGTDLELTKNPDPDEAIDHGTYKVTITFSEPVSTETGKAPSLYIVTFDTNQLTALSCPDPVNAPNVWVSTMTIGEYDLSHEGKSTMTITAQDLAGKTHGTETA